MLSDFYEEFGRARGRIFGKISFANVGAIDSCEPYSFCNVPYLVRAVLLALAFDDEPPRLRHCHTTKRQKTSFAQIVFLVASSKRIDGEGVLNLEDNTGDISVEKGCIRGAAQI